MRSLAVILVASLVTSCGAVGPPVAPEMVGVEPTIRQQKQQHQQEALETQQRKKAAAAESDLQLQGQDVELPPLQPVGTR